MIYNRLWTLQSSGVVNQAVNCDDSFESQEAGRSGLIIYEDKSRSRAWVNVWLLADLWPSGQVEMFRWLPLSQEGMGLKMKMLKIGHGRYLWNEPSFHIWELLAGGPRGQRMNNLLISTENCCHSGATWSPRARHGWRPEMTISGAESA